MKQSAGWIPTFWVFIILAPGHFLLAGPLLMATNNQQPTASSNINKYTGHALAAGVLPHMLLRGRGNLACTDKNREILYTNNLCSYYNLNYIYNKLIKIENVLF